MSQTPMPSAYNSAHAQWMPFYGLAAVLGALTPLILWACLTANLFLSYLLFGGGIVAGFVLIVAVLGTALCYLVSRNVMGSEAELKKLRRALCLGIVTLLWLVAMSAVAPPTWQQGQAWSRENGNTVASALEEFRSIHGRYPYTLAEAEKGLGRRLPGPYGDSEFHYFSDGKTFSMTYRGGGLFDWCTLDGETTILICPD